MRYFLTVVIYCLYSLGFAQERECFEALQNTFQAKIFEISSRLIRTDGRSFDSNGSVKSRRLKDYAFFSPEELGDE